MVTIQSLRILLMEDQHHIMAFLLALNTRQHLQVAHPHLDLNQKFPYSPYLQLLFRYAPTHGSLIGYSPQTYTLLLFVSLLS